jgi:transposase-like protein
MVRDARGQVAFDCQTGSHVCCLWCRRDIERILAKRGVAVSRESVRHWCIRFGADLAAELRKRRPRPGETWHLDEVLILPANRQAA